MENAAGGKVDENQRVAAMVAFEWEPNNSVRYPPLQSPQVGEEVAVRRSKELWNLANV